MPSVPVNFQQRLHAVRRFVLLTASATFSVLLAVLFFVPVDEQVAATGTVVSERDTYLFSPMDGVLGKIRAPEGSQVAGNDVVLTLDDTPFRDRLRQIDASLAKAQNELSARQAAWEKTGRLPLPKEFWHANEELDIWREKVRQSGAEVERDGEMVTRGLISRQELERAQLALSINRTEEAKARERLQIVQSGLGELTLDETAAQLQKARSEVRALEVERDITQSALERCAIRSPDAGVVTLVLKRRPGEVVKAGEDLAHVAHGEPSRVEIRAGENQYHRISPGQRVRMTSNAFDAWRYGYVEGLVERIALEPEASGQIPKYRILVRIESTPQPLVLGSTVTAEIILRRVPLWRLLLPHTQ